MDSNNYVSQIAKALNKILFILLFVVSAVAVAQTAIIFYMYKHKEIQYLPPVVTQAYKASQVRPDNAYLQMMTGWILSLKLNVTPENVVSGFKQLKGYVCPSYYSAVNDRLRREARTIKKDKLSASLHISGYSHPSDLSVVAKGVLYKAVGSRKIDSEKSYYQVSYQYNNGTLCFKDIKQVKVKK